MNSRLILDVSNANPLRHGDLQKSGAAGLYAKATEGASFHDDTLTQHEAEAHSAGVPFGSYLFLRVGSPGSEAAFYLRWARPRAGGLEPVVDAEDDADTAALALRTHSCLLALEAAGYRPILYANVADLLRMIKIVPELRHYRVWQAQYPGRLTRWAPRLAKLRIRLQHRLTVVMWQWTDHYAVGPNHYDASRLLVPIESLRIQSRPPL